MSKERWNPISRAAFGAPPPAASRGPAQGFRPGGVYSRHSNGLEQFFTHIAGTPGLTILDLSGASQENIGFITGLGHRLSSESLLQSLDSIFGGPDFLDNQSDLAKVDAFLAEALNFPENRFDGVLVWDVLEYLAPPLLKAVVDRLSRITKPESYLLSIFHADERAEMVPVYSYRITDAGNLLLTPREMRRPAQLFNNRAVEKLFQSFASVKFFLTRDSLREVIVKR